MMPKPSTTLLRSAWLIVRLQAVCLISISVVVGVFTAFALYMNATKVAPEQTAAAFIALFFLRMKAIALGGLIGILSTAISVRSVVNSSRAMKAGFASGGVIGLAPIYAGLLSKIFFVAGGVLLGLHYFAYPPFYIFLGYSTMLLAYVWVAMLRA